MIFQMSLEACRSKGVLSSAKPCGPRGLRPHGSHRRLFVNRSRSSDRVREVCVVDGARTVRRLPEHLMDGLKFEVGFFADLVVTGGPLAA